MKEFLELIAKSLVDDPEKVTVEVVETERNITLKLSVAEEDTGKVIGNVSLCLNHFNSHLFRIVNK